MATNIDPISGSQARFERRGSMLPRRSRCCCSVAVSALSLLLVIIPLSSSQAGENGSIVCTEDSRVTLANGTLVYGPLPPTNPPDTEEYRPQGLKGWYDMARGFVNFVQPVNLPYDVIEETIETNNLACSVRGRENCEAGDVDVQTTLKDFGEWWAPLIGVTVLGGVMAMLFGLVGAIFWCCRCCGQCGGGRSKQEPQDKYMLVVTILLLLLALLLFVGVVLSFYSNEQSYDSIESLQVTINDIIDIAVGYMDDFINDGDALFCQFVQVTDIAFDETEVLNSSLNALIGEVEVDVNTVLQQLDGLSKGINQTSDILTDVRDTTTTLQSLSSTLATSLSDAANASMTLSSNCGGAVPECSQIPDSSTLQAGADYSNLPDVSQELNDVEASLDNIDLSRSIEQGNAEFDRITREIQSEVNSHLSGIDGSSDSSVLSSLIDANETLFATRDTVIGDIREVIRNDYNIDDCPSLDELLNFSSDDEVDVGFIRQCYFNQVFERLQEYDTIRYAFGIIICCLSLLSVILIFVAITMGVLGWRKDRSPDSRTKLSHCGGIIILINVGLMFIFGFVLLILASLAFFFGSNMQKICQAVEPPEYELFTRIIDNRELWGGSLIGAALERKYNLNYTLFISEALTACDNDTTFYSAFNLSDLFDIRMEALNTTETFDNLEQQVNDTIDSFNYTSDSFLDAETRSALNDFTAASVDSINITAFNEILSEGILDFDINDTISTLTDLSNELRNDPNLASLQSDTDAIIADLEDIRDNQIPDIEFNVDLLTRQVANLSDHIDNVVLNTDDVVADIDGLVVRLTGDEFRGQVQTIAFTSLGNLERYIISFINHIADSAETDVGGCRPLSTIYSSAYDLACNEVVDGLNGYWWSLGFCAVCFIPLIILSVITSTHYLRQKKPYDDDDDDDAYPEYPMKAK